ncbi:MAG: 50S ribosomal protein L30e [archaeon]
MEVDESKEIRRAVDTGKVVFGAKNAEKTILKDNAQLIVTSNNIPKPIKEKLSHIAKISAINVYEFNGNSTELGSVCGKPFAVSALSVLDTGKSKLMTIAKTVKKNEVK